MENPNAPATVGPKPTVGRIVHVFDSRFSGGKQPLAAIVTAVLANGGINAAVFAPGGMAMAAKAIARRANPGDEPAVNCLWDWPQRD